MDKSVKIELLERGEGGRLQNVCVAMISFCTNVVNSPNQEVYAFDISHASVAKRVIRHF